MNIQYLKPYIHRELVLARKAYARNAPHKAFRHLENAHVLGQYSTYYHTLVHLKMLGHGLRYKSAKEIIGQVIRIVGALTKTAIGLLPTGNTGGSNVSAFKPMPLSPRHARLMQQARNKAPT